MSRAARKPMSTARAEERAAARRVRAMNRARRAKATAAARRRAQIITEELSSPRARECSCPITPQTTIAELTALGAGCTTGRWVCPTLDAIRRRLRI